MKQILTDGIILKRTDYGEADRIITVLTPERGKLRLMARGVRKVKSKLAGGIELFSTSQLTYIEGKGEIGTLISSRLEKHYGRIVGDIARVQLGYELIKLLDKTTEDHPEPDYYYLLEQAFAALDDNQVDTELIRLWFQAQLIRLAGHAPNLQTDSNGDKLSAETAYNFDFEAMAFSPHASGRFMAAQVKTLRLLFSGHSAAEIAKVQGIAEQLEAIAPLIRTMLTSYVQV
ncbi:MAG TPA: DNA repair protein RecO [Candidatus Saccharimonadales bacterium]|nr:DNA repair protein RecO [Candidatus Saccharimonadales bacterium]